MVTQCAVGRYGTADGFDEYDANGDGIIDPDEWRRGNQRKAFRTMDRNKDAKISREEWIARCVVVAVICMYANRCVGVVVAICTHAVSYTHLTLPTKA